MGCAWFLRIFACQRQPVTVPIVKASSALMSDLKNAINDGSYYILLSIISGHCQALLRSKADISQTTEDIRAVSL